LAAENKKYFPESEAVKIDDYILNVEYVEGMNPEEIGYPTFIKQLMFGMDDLPE
jgi:hypothetical protein